MTIYESTCKYFQFGSALLYHLVFSSSGAVYRAFMTRDFREIEYFCFGVYVFVTWPLRTRIQK